MPLSDQFGQCAVATVHQEVRASVEVPDGDSVRIDSQRAVQRREHLLKVYGSIIGLGTEPVGRSDDLPRFQITSRQQSA